ncbi:nesprin-1-like [Gigantopelta aegis]|uniref:nesprin-1-like n=1 Tax=Gigantopelta aegis TaxID=1735272 RepID=UPI001B88E743|nr:nesprin-1-like [Gigantopelta aegis]
MDVLLLNTQMPEIESNFKITTKTAQSLVKDSSQEEVNEMLQTLNRHKEVIVRLRKDIPEKIKTINSILPNVESLETGISDLNEWLTEGESLLQTHRLDGSAEATEARLEKHKSFFSDTTYQKSILESKKKVFDKVYNVKNKLQNVDFLPVKQLMDEVMERFQNCVAGAKDWEKQLETLSKLWRTLHQKEQVLEEWLDNAETVLDDKEDDPESLLRKHKLFFDRVDQRILDNYLTVGQEILQLLPEGDKANLKRDMANLQARWKNIHYNAPMKQLKLEFALPEDKFLATVMNAEKIIREHQEKLSRRENVKDALMKHRQLFQDGQIVQTCEKCLGSMEQVSKKLLHHNAEDKSLLRRYEEHLERWQRLRSVADSTHEQLKQLPERWKEYNSKLSDFNKWVMEVEGLVQAMQKEDLTSDEYKDMLAKFQKAMRNKSKYAEDAKWLSENLNELLSDSSGSDSRKEQERLAAMLSRFGNLDVTMKDASEKSSVFSKSFEYRDGLERRSNWLEETQRQVMEHPAIDSLDDARAYLQEHEAIMMKLETEAASIQADIEAGKRLQKQKDAPSFIGKSVDDLSRKWKDTNELAKSKHTKLKETLRNWEQYEGEKKHLIQYLKKAETELEKPPASHGQDSAQKDLQTKKELHNTLNKLKGSLSEMQKLNSVLAESASRERQGPLKGEVSDIDKRLQNVSVRLNAKLADLEGTIAKWSDYYKRLNNFNDWLNQKESNLNQVYEEKKDLPEEQLSKAETICSEVYENHITLENLEKDARGLSQNFRSRETAALKSKLTTIRRQWESLCARAKDRSTALSGNVAHWQRYQSLQEQLMPWIVKAEKYCATELPKCSSLEEAKDLYDLHQSFLQEAEENLPIFDKMSTEAGYLMEQPNMPRELESIQRRWGNILAASEERSHRVDKMHGAWAVYDEEQANLIDGLEKLLNRLAQEPNTSSTDVQVLEHELALAKALQEEVRSYQPQVNAVQRQFEQVQPYTSPDGLRELKAKQDMIKEMWARVNAGVQDKQKVLGQAVQHRKDFYTRLQDFEKWLKKSQRKLDTGSEIYSDEVSDVLAKLKDIRDDMYAYNPEYEQLRELGRQIMQSDPSKAQSIQTQLADVNKAWESVQALLGEKHQNYSNVANLWQQYNDSKQGVARVLADVEPLVNQDIAFSDQKALKKSLDQHKNAEFELHANQTQLDHMNNKGMQLLEELKKVPNFKIDGLENDLDDINLKWEKTNSAIDDHKENMEAQLVCWDQVQSGTDEVASWVNNMVSKLDDSLNNFNDAVSVEARLIKFKEEAPYFAEVLKEVNQKVKDLQEMNSGQVNPELLKTQQKLQEQFDRASAMAGQLDTVMSTFSSEQQDLQGSISEESEWMNHIKELLAKCDDLSGNDEDLVARYKAAKELQEELAKHKDKIAAIQSKTQNLHAKYPSAETSNLAKDANVMMKKFEALAGRADRIEDSLVGTLEQHCQEAQQQQARWLNQAKEKIAWCGDMAGDRYSVEAKLSTIKVSTFPFCLSIFSSVFSLITFYSFCFLFFSFFFSFVCLFIFYSHFHFLLSFCFLGLEEGEQKKALAAARLEAIKSVLPKSKQAELEAQKKAMEKEWDSLVGNIEQTQSKLENSIEQWQDYDGQYEGLAQWLKETEAKMRSESSLRPDLAGKMEQRQLLKELEEGCQTQRQAFEALLDNAQQIALTTGDNRTASYASQLLGRFQTLASALKEQEERCEQNIDDHENFTAKFNTSSDWLKAAQKKLEECSDNFSDEESLDARLAVIQDLLANKDLGLAQFNAALESGEKLFPNTSNEGRENIRRDLRALRNMWENFQDTLNETQRQLESSRMQWSSFDENFDQLAKWLDDMETQMNTEPEKKNTLQEKKGVLQHYKTRSQDITSHQRMIDNINDKGQALSSSQIRAKLKQLNNKYSTLRATAQSRVEQAEEYVDQHQLYQDQYQQCWDWMSATNDKLAICAEVTSDKQALQNRMDRVQDIQAAMSEGEQKLTSVRRQGEKVIPQTAAHGQHTIQQELDILKQDWERLGSSITDIEQSLGQAQQALVSYDSSCETLGHWLRETEAEVKDQELKSSLDDKINQVEHLKVTVYHRVMNSTLN